MTALFLTMIFTADPVLNRMEVQVDGVTREALVSVPEGASKEKPAPVVFGFHGHGGSMRNASRQFGIEKVWPEAVVVYMQGLKTPTRRDPVGDKPGWQNRPGLQSDRDLKAFDAFLALIKTKTAIDESRIYATGHSNGGGFTYCLWAGRPDIFAAIAPSSANPPIPETLKPIPVFHVSGKTDVVVSYEGQVRTMEGVRKVNGCDDKGTEWARQCTLYKSSKGAPVVWLVHEGGHEYASQAPALFVRFFKEHKNAPATAEPPAKVSTER
jgi:polyhydroxybutyrate depolymerase